MKKAMLFLLMCALGIALFAQQGYALVIGNSNYTGISSLANPVNDAADMETALRALGFSVERVLDGSLVQMETAVENLRRSLSASRDSLGFFFFAGHGGCGGTSGNNGSVGNQGFTDVHNTGTIIR